MYTAKTKTYVALLSQSGTGIPIAQVVQNTIGDIVWTRAEAGGYEGTLTGAFTENKTILMMGQVSNADTIAAEWSDENSIWISTINAGTPGDNVLVNTPIEIRVYR